MPMFLVTLLISESEYEVYILTDISLICAHELICISRFYMAFEGFIVAGTYMTM